MMPCLCPRFLCMPLAGAGLLACGGIAHADALSKQQFPTGDGGQAVMTVPGCVASSGFVYPCGTNGTTTSVLQAGGSPADGSANAAAVPITGYGLLATIAANPARAGLECQNQDVSAAQLVLDDGLGTTATISIYMLAAADTTGGQGASWSDPSFKGRLRVYGPNAGQRVMCRQE